MPLTTLGVLPKFIERLNTIYIITKKSFCKSNNRRPERLTFRFTYSKKR